MNRVLFVQLIDKQLTTSMEIEFKNAPLTKIEKISTLYQNLHER